MKRYFIFFILIIIDVNALAQIEKGISIGITSNIGTTINRIGVCSNAFLVYNNYQVNFRVAYHNNITHWGNRTQTPELQIGLGSVFGFGLKDSIPFNQDLISNQTYYNTSIGYAINFYLDKNETSQRTGTIAIQHNNWRIISENDILGEFGVDKFRTAAALIDYYEPISRIQYGIKLLLWTGNFRDKQALRIKNDTLFEARYGYYDLSNTKHGKESHGIMCIQAYKQFEYSQQAKLMLGIDSEHIRNIFQNKLMHDAKFIPDKFLKYKNLHFPMLTSDGELFLYRENQQVSPPTPFINISTNDNIFY